MIYATQIPPRPSIAPTGNGALYFSAGGYINTGVWLYSPTQKMSIKKSFYARVNKTTHVIVNSTTNYLYKNDVIQYTMPFTLDIGDTLTIRMPNAPSAFTDIPFARVDYGIA